LDRVDQQSLSTVGCWFTAFSAVPLSQFLSHALPGVPLNVSSRTVLSMFRPDRDKSTSPSATVNRDSTGLGPQKVRISDSSDVLLAKETLNRSTQTSMPNPHVSVRCRALCVAGLFRVLKMPHSECPTLTHATHRHIDASPSSPKIGDCRIFFARGQKRATYTVTLCWRCSPPKCRCSFSRIPSVPARNCSRLWFTPMATSHTSSAHGAGALIAEDESRVGEPILAGPAPSEREHVHLTDAVPGRRAPAYPKEKHSVRAVYSRVTADRLYATAS
jgi:hypothetical protein